MCSITAKSDKMYMYQYPGQFQLLLGHQALALLILTLDGLMKLQGITHLLWWAVVRVQNRFIRNIVCSCPEICTRSKVYQLEASLPLCIYNVQRLDIPVHKACTM
jgi:hypothetical protein